MFTTEGLDVMNWGNTIIWMGYHNRKDWDDDGNPFWAWNDANGNTMDPYSGADFWGMDYFKREGVTYSGSSGGSNTATINDEAGNELFVIDYDVNQADPTCIGVSYEYNEEYETGVSDEMYKLQWREFSCRRSENAICEIDLKKNKQCFFGTTDEISTRKVFLNHICFVSGINSFTHLSV